MTPHEMKPAENFAKLRHARRATSTMQWRKPTDRKWHVLLLHTQDEHQREHDPDSGEADHEHGDPPDGTSGQEDDAGHGADELRQQEQHRRIEGEQHEEQTHGEE